MAYDNMTIAKRYVEEICSKGNFNLLDELVAKDIIVRDTVIPEGRGHDYLKSTINEFRTAFPDLAFTIDDVLATSGDRMVVRWTARGTHRGSLMGVAATNRRPTIKGLEVLRVVDGKIRESDMYWDAYGLFYQLGVLPRLEDLAKLRPIPQPPTGARPEVR